MTSVAGGFDLGSFLEHERVRVNEALERVANATGALIPGSVGEALRHGLLTGGKRLRPILCIASFRACGGGPDPALYDLAVALEMIHAYSLMHDDLPCMDDAELRRGAPTPHVVFGETATAVAGIALIPAAMIQAFDAARALGRSEEESGEIVRRLASAAGGGGMVGGQAMDLASEGRSLPEPELDRLHGMKTGALLSAALQVGALAAGAARSLVDALERYGCAVGLAFQITDDVLDATSSVRILGKHPSDRDLGKSTYVGLHGAEEALRLARAHVEGARLDLERAGIVDPALRSLAEFVVGRAR